MSKYVINCEGFKTKKALLERIRKIRDDSSDFVILPKDDFDFMLDVLKMHPHAHKKIGSGVAEMYVRPHPEYYNSRGFWLIRTSGEHINFSFNECIHPRSREAYAKTLFRFAVDPHIFAHKKQFFEENKEPRCQLSNITIPFDRAHVHHLGENTFAKILSDFCSEYGVDLTQVEGKDSHTGRDSLASDRLRRLFVEFHNERAELIVVDKSIHAELHGQVGAPSNW